MATTRRNAMLIAEARQKIRTTQLIKRLQDHVLGLSNMSASQVRAAEILLRKSVPDLLRSEVTGKDGGPLEHEHRMDVPREETREEWLARLETAARSAASGDSGDLVH